MATVLESANRWGNVLALGVGNHYGPGWGILLALTGETLRPWLGKGFGPTLGNHYGPDWGIFLALDKLVTLPIAGSNLYIPHPQVPYHRLPLLSLYESQKL